MYDNFVLIVIAVAAAIYLLIRLATLRRARASASPVPGLATALFTGVLGATLLVFGSLVLSPLAWLVNRDRLLELLAPPFLFDTAVIALAVLIVYAIWPARPGDRGSDVGRALAGVVLAFLAVVPIDGAISSAVQREAEAERLQATADEQQAILDRSAALSIVVTVVDARLGASSQHGGHVVSQLTLDIRVRSTADIELIDAAAGADHNHWINLSAQTVSTGGIQPEDGMGLPSHLPAGFDATYRVEVSVDALTWADAPISGFEPADRFTTGPWKLLLSLYGAHAQGSPQVIHRVETTFTVPDQP